MGRGGGCFRSRRHKMTLGRGGRGGRRRSRKSNKLGFGELRGKGTEGGKGRGSRSRGSTMEGLSFLKVNTLRRRRKLNRGKIHWTAH